MKIGTTSKLLAALLVLSASAAAAAFLSSNPPPFGANQVLDRLPRGSSVHSLLRADLDGRGPLEVAVVARIPAFPGAPELIYAALLFRYDRLRREFAEVYRGPTPGRVPFSVDVLPTRTGREVVVFSGLREDGTRAQEIVGLVKGRGMVLPDAAPINANADPVLPLPSVIWRYTVRNGIVVARTKEVRLRARQPLRVQASGGGAASIVLPDARLDVLEAGYRARRPGTYRIRIVTGFTPVDEAYVLTVVVEP